MCLCLDTIDDGDGTPAGARAGWWPPYRKRSVFVGATVACGLLLAVTIVSAERCWFER